jgi:hypothetical protein
MYSIKETRADHMLMTDTATDLYVFNQNGITEINKDALATRRFLSDVNDFGKVFPYRGGLLFNFNGNMAREKDNVITQMGEGLSPVLLDGEDIIAAERVNTPHTLQRIKPDGSIQWKKELKLSVERLVHNGTLYFSRIDNVSVRFSIVNKLSLETGEFKELINLEDYYHQKNLLTNVRMIRYHILTCYENTLVCLVNDKRIIGIDIESGAVKWEVEEWYDRDGSKLDGFVGGPLQGGRYGDKIYILQAATFSCFDLQSNQLIQLKTIQHDLNGSPLFIKRGTLYKDKIFYTADDKGKNWNRAGVFDINKEEIVWQTELPLAKGEMLNYEPVVSEKHFFINDNVKNLYIFDKTV